MKRPTPNSDLYGELISLASELTRGIPRELRASLATSIREQCISAVTMLALREAGSRLPPDDAELLSRLDAIQIMANATHAKRMVANRIVQRLARLLDQIRAAIAAAGDDPSASGIHEFAGPLVAADPATPTCIGGQLR